MRMTQIQEFVSISLLLSLNVTKVKEIALHVIQGGVFMYMPHT